MIPRGAIKSSVAKKYGFAAALAATIAAPVTAHYEGLRTRAYLDPIGVPTICFGETLGVKEGDFKTVEECKDMLNMRLGYFALQVDRAIDTDLPPETHAAFTSIAYNIGVDGFKRSSMTRLANEGNLQQACEFMRRYVYAGGKKLNGLVKRREAEVKLCLSGL